MLGFFRNILIFTIACILAPTGVHADIPSGNHLSTIALYQSIVQNTPGNVQNTYTLGRLFYLNHDWDEAIKIFEKTLSLQPKDQDARLMLSYAYLARYRSQSYPNESKGLFEEILKEVPTYTDAEQGLKRLEDLKPVWQEKPQPSILGLSEIIVFENLTAAHPKDPVYYYILGRAYYDFGAYDESILAFRQTLKLQPGNTDAKLGLAYSLMYSYVYQDDLYKSRKLFKTVLKAYPNYMDAQNGIKLVNKLIYAPQEEKINKELTPKQKWEKSLAERAQDLSKQKDHDGAIEIYEQLTDEFPENAEYFYLLGREYAQAENRCNAIYAFKKAIEIKNDYTDALIGLGNQYLYFKWIEDSLGLFERAVEANPKDTAGLVGAARAEALLERPARAEAYYNAAMSLQPDNPDVVLPYAAFLLGQRYYTEADAAYRQLAWMQNDDETYRTYIFDTSSYTRPDFYAIGGSAEEREKDLFTHQWVASLRYINGEAGLFFPINDRFRFSVRGRWLDVRQRNLITKTILFETKFIGGGIRGEWFIDPYWTFTANANFNCIYNNNTHAVLPTKRGTKFEPSFVFRYAKDLDMVTFGEITDSWIFKNFTKGHVSVFTRESLFFVYQHDFEDQRLAGLDGAWLWYQDPIYNQEQDVNVWAQTGIPYFEEILSLRYHCEYRHFRKETDGYYSFKYQLTHWLKWRFYKTWSFGGRCEILYWHGWRTTRGKNPQQQITTGGAFALFPVVTIEDQIDAIYLTLGYKPSTNFDISLSGSYWHDSYDYTIVGAAMQLDWKF